MDDPLTVSLMDPNPKFVPTPTRNIEEGNSELVVGEKFYSRRCKRKSSLTNYIESLRDELVFNILLHLPAQDIYVATILVCKKWYKVIHIPNFIHKHLHHSTPGLLIQYHPRYENAVFMTMKRGRVEISRFRYKLRVIVEGSCNGLTVESDYTGPLYIANPATNQSFLLPPCLHLNAPFRHCGLAYDPSSMKYKAVIAQDWNYEINKQDCAILTIGVDKSWRYVDTKHLSGVSRRLFLRVPTTTKGFLHWTSIKDNNIVTLNVETEIITETPNPQGYEKKWKYYLSNGRSLTLLTQCNDFTWEFWNMKPEIGEWTKLPKIDLDAPKGKFERLVGEASWPRLHLLKPVGWLNEEVLVFRESPSPVCILYSVHTQEIDLFELNCYSSGLLFTAHRNSLLSVGGS